MCNLATCWQVTNKLGSNNFKDKSQIQLVNWITNIDQILEEDEFIFLHNTRKQAVEGLGYRRSQRRSPTLLLLHIIDNTITDRQVTDKIINDVRESL